MPANALNLATDTIKKNIVMLNQTADTAAQMADSASNFADMAKQVRKNAEKKSRFGV